MHRSRIVFLLLCGATFVGAGPERKGHTELHWDGKLPPEEEAQPESGLRRKPLLVYVASDIRSPDQERFEDVVMKVETFRLASRFFERAQVTQKRAAEHWLLRDVNFKPPAVIVFDSTRKKHAVARGRASAMKVWGVMRKIGQPDYKTNMQVTVRKATVLLGTFDQVDAARSALGIKRGRVEKYRAKGDMAKVKQLEKDCNKDQAQIEKLYSKTERDWRELWELRLKPRLRRG